VGFDVLGDFRGLSTLLMVPSCLIFFRRFHERSGRTKNRDEESAGIGAMYRGWAAPRGSGSDSGML